jgi:alpha-beta hydrolase superfamily lysophospholipase
MAFFRLIGFFVIGTIKQFIRALAYFIAGGFVVLIIFGIFNLNNRPELKIWHTAVLDEEFTVNSDIHSFSEYRTLEKRLFKQLNENVFDKIATNDKTLLNRFNRGSRADPQQWPINFNQSYELSVLQPRAGVVLIHGMSDSPYSLRSIGDRLNADGAWVTSLRVPGHGTAPVGLVNVNWQDMEAAVKLAVKHVREKIGEKPLFIIGYSNGGALALQYTLNTLQDGTLPKVQRLVLISPEIAVTKLAMFAVWQERLGHLLGLEKLAWNSILPEYDSFKYNSFALNAGKQAHEITLHNQELITQLDRSGDLKRLPPILAFQSVVDATVITEALVDNLFNRLKSSKHELVMFDINRNANIEPLLINNPTGWINNKLLKQKHSYTITLITNKNKHSKKIIAKVQQPETTNITECSLDGEWPNNLYSLSHVALATPPDDPLYGGKNIKNSSYLALGRLALRGERGVLQISAADLLRLQWNPFYNYLESRTREFIGLATPVAICL